MSLGDLGNPPERLGGHPVSTLVRGMHRCAPIIWMPPEAQLDVPSRLSATGFAAIFMARSRVTPDRPVSRRTRLAPTPAPIAGGPASQSVADPSESAQRTDLLSRSASAASSTSYSTAGTAGLLSETAMIALPFPGATTGLRSVWHDLRCSSAGCPGPFRLFRACERG